MTFDGPTKYMVEEPATEKKLKFPEIPKLDDYKICPPVGYRKSFPFRDLPSRPTTKVNVSFVRVDKGKVSKNEKF